MSDPSQSATTFQCACGQRTLTSAGFCTHCGLYWAEHDHEPNHDVGEAQAEAATERAEAFFEIAVAKYDADSQTWTEANGAA